MIIGYRNGQITIIKLILDLANKNCYSRKSFEENPSLFSVYDIKCAVINGALELVTDRELRKDEEQLSKIYLTGQKQLEENGKDVAIQVMNPIAQKLEADADFTGVGKTFIAYSILPQYDFVDLSFATAMTIHPAYLNETFEYISANTQNDFVSQVANNSNAHMTACSDEVFLKIPTPYQIQSEDGVFGLIPDNFNFIEDDRDDTYRSKGYKSYVPPYRLDDIDGLDSNNTAEIFSNEKRYYDELVKLIVDCGIEGEAIEVISPAVQMYLEILASSIYIWGWSHRQNVPDLIDLESDSAKDETETSIDSRYQFLTAGAKHNGCAVLTDFLQEAYTEVGKEVYPSAIIQLLRWGKRKGTKIIINGFGKVFNLRDGSVEISNSLKGCTLDPNFTLYGKIKQGEHTVGLMVSQDFVNENGEVTGMYMKVMDLFNAHKEFPELKPTDDLPTVQLTTALEYRSAGNAVVEFSKSVKLKDTLLDYKIAGNVTLLEAFRYSDDNLSDYVFSNTQELRNLVLKKTETTDVIMLKAMCNYWLPRFENDNLEGESEVDFLKIKPAVTETTANTEATQASGFNKPAGGQINMETQSVISTIPDDATLLAVTLKGETKLWAYQDSMISPYSGKRIPLYTVTSNPKGRAVSGTMSIGKLAAYVVQAFNLRFVNNSTLNQFFIEDKESIIALRKILSEADI